MASPALKLEDHISIEDYLEGEKFSEVRHEYADGKVFAVAGASDGHEAVATNLTVVIGQFLKGKRCRLFKDGMKVRADFLKRSLFYYPDLMVVCSRQDNDPLFKTEPKLLIEILSTDENKDSRREVRSLHTNPVARGVCDHPFRARETRGLDLSKKRRMGEGRALDLRSLGITEHRPQDWFR